jgi:hypothetical protein
MKKKTKNKQKYLQTYKIKQKKMRKIQSQKTYKIKQGKKHLRKTYKKHNFFLQKGGMVADPPDNCAICLSSLKDKPTRTTPCGHTFHEQCLQEWLSRSNTCPFCRARVNPVAPVAPNIDADANIMRQAFQLCRAGSLYMLQVLLHEHPFHVNVIQTEDPQIGWTLLHVAAFNGNMGIVNMLIALGVYSNARTPTMQLASDIARNQGHEEVAVIIERAIAANDARQAEMRAQIMREELEEAETSPADSIPRAFRLINNFEVMRVSVMLEAGIIEPTSRFNIGNSDQWTLLHMAASRGQMPLIQELLWRGASARALTLPRGETSRGETPAQIARRTIGMMRPEIAPFLEAAAEVAAGVAVTGAGWATRDEAELAMAAATPAMSIVDDDL